MIAAPGRPRQANELRKRIVEIVYEGKDGHIPSAFSIIDLIDVLYDSQLRHDPAWPEWPDRDYFILSKGHGCVALYAVLEKQGYLTREEVSLFCKPGGILGEHPDCTKVPGVEASTGSLGHGLPFAVGIALGLRIAGRNNRVYVLIGDGESNEGTVWESALVAANLRLGNLCCIVDKNGSAAQILPMDPMTAKWEAFGWAAGEIDGHDADEIRDALAGLRFEAFGQPKVIVANTLKGKGVGMLEGHGQWHHRIPNEQEFRHIMEALS
jgi:transketolase